eukprot:3989266-Alexandrium_andersonii.AAC.1
MLPRSYVGTPLRSLNPLVKVSSGAENPARGGRGPSTPDGLNSTLRGSEPAKVGDPRSAGPNAGGAALRAAPP